MIKLENENNINNGYHIDEDGTLVITDKRAEISSEDKVRVIKIKFEITHDNNKTTYDKKIKYIYGFEDCTNLVSIDIPKGVEAISIKAFKGCNSLKSVIIPDSVKYIHNWAFSECTSLESVIIPSSVKVIYPEAFKGCINLKSVVISDGVETIREKAFQYCNSLTNITIPNSVTSIGYGAFKGCSNLKSVVIPRRTTFDDIWMGNSIFAGCNKDLIIYTYNEGIMDYCWNNSISFKDLQK